MMSESISRIFGVPRCRSAVVGLLIGLAAAVPARAGDWSSAPVSLGPGGPRVSVSNAPTAGGLAQFGPGAGGLVATFDQDFGDIVLGGSFRQGRGVRSGGLGLGDDVQRIDLRAGYDFGQSLGYLTVGEVGSGRGALEQSDQVYGFGLRISVNRILQMTGEVLHREGAQDGRDGVLRGDILSVEAAFRF